MKAEMNGLNERVVKKLIEKSLHISSAESCSGGLFSALITAVPGSSEILDEAIVTYSNNAKSKRLGVREETLQSYGAVSKQTANEMAEGIVSYASSDIGIAITGIAGPGGGTEEIPVGTVWIGCCVRDAVFTKKLQLDGTREIIRQKAKEEAILFVCECLKSCNI